MGDKEKYSDSVNIPILGEIKNTMETKKSHDQVQNKKQLKKYAFVIPS